MTIKGKLKTKDEPTAKGKIEGKQDVTNSRKVKDQVEVNLDATSNRKAKGKQDEKERPSEKNIRTAGAVEVDKIEANRQLEVKKYVKGKKRPVGEKHPKGKKHPIERELLEDQRVPENKRDLAAGDSRRGKERRGPRGINVGWNTRRNIGLTVHAQENPRGYLRIHESGLILS